MSTLYVLTNVHAERRRQDAKWGEQHHPDGTSTEYYKPLADQARKDCDDLAGLDGVTWADILKEEFFEALAEEDPVKLRTELIQVAAVAVRWAEDIDSRAHSCDGDEHKDTCDACKEIPVWR